MDLTKVTAEELDTLSFDVAAEQRRRNRLSTIPEQVNRLNTEYLTADGQVEGGEWVQPTGAHDAYPLGWKVSDGGKEFESLVSGNVWKPPTNWREATKPGDGPPDFVQPTGSEDAYSKGDTVTFQGAVYESLLDANSWSPANYPAGWKKIT